jgi:hypothetical protein
MMRGVGHVQPLTARVCFAALLLGAAPATVHAQRWDLALTGGFVANGLIDRVYALGTVSGRPTRVVVRETDQENAVSVGVAMFAQIYHDRQSLIAPLSIGLGLRSDARATVYMGSALRFGSHASLTGASRSVPWRRCPRACPREALLPIRTS